MAWPPPTPSLADWAAGRPIGGGGIQDFIMSPMRHTTMDSNVVTIKVGKIPHYCTIISSLGTTLLIIAHLQDESIHSTLEVPSPHSQSPPPSLCQAGFHVGVQVENRRGVYGDAGGGEGGGQA